MSKCLKQIDYEEMLNTVKNLVLRGLEGADARVYLFGSWARGEQRKTSDIDIAIEHKGDLSPRAISNIRELLEESYIPYRVDVVDLTRAGTVLANRVKQEGLVWKDYAND